MVGMNPQRMYDYLMTARRSIFDGTRPLSAEQYTQTFPIGLGSLARILTHIMICEWFYVQRIQQREVPPYEQWPIQDEKPPPFAVLESTWSQQAPQTEAALQAVSDWHAPIEYPSQGGARPTIVTASASDLFTQLVLHEVHHRAQVMNILRQLGAAVKDVDFNALMYQRRPIDGGV